MRESPARAARRQDHGRKHAAPMIEPARCGCGAASPALQTGRLERLKLPRPSSADHPLGRLGASGMGPETSPQQMPFSTSHHKLQNRNMRRTSCHSKIPQARNEIWASNAYGKSTSPPQRGPPTGLHRNSRLPTQSHSQTATRCLCVEITAT